MSANTRWQVAKKMEKTCIAALEEMLAPGASAQELEIWRHCQAIQEQYVQWLTSAERSIFPEVDAEALIERQQIWAKLSQEQNQEKTGTDYFWLGRLWQYLAWLERLESLYKQMAAHTIFPLEQIFFKNLAHGQWLLHRRLSALAQQQHNLLWEELGFAPFEKL